jgi:hypothetical protein
MNTENEKVNEVNEIKNEVVVENKKIFRAPVLIIVLLYLIGAFAVSWYIGMKEYDEINGIKDNEEIIDVPTVPKEEKLEIDSTKSSLFSNNFDYVLQNVFIDSRDHLIPDNMRNSVDLLSDDVNRFKIVYYIVERYGLAENKLYNVSENGKEVTGAFAVKYDYFKNYYQEVIGSEFDEIVLTKVNNNYKVVGEYLFGTVLSGMKSNFKIVPDSFIKKENNYYYTVIVNELDENDVINLTYKVTLNLSKLNDKYVIDSIIVS